jgi:carbamoyltransferase
MGLAPYGEPKYKKLITDNLIDVKDDGSFKLDQSFFEYSTGLKMISKRFSKLFGNKPRNPEKEKLTQFHMDIASSIQEVTEDVMLKITSSLAKEYNIKNLCLAGGVALNCVTNGKILRSGKFKNIWIQPAAGDAGGSLGAAIGLWYIELKKNRTINSKDDMNGSYLGPEYSNSEIEKQLKEAGANFEILDDQQLIEKTVLELCDGKAVGWFQGRMEFGPRALGCRSILGDARLTTMQKNLNLKVKYRESFRPFAPSVIREDLSDWFEMDCDSPYMLFVSDVAINKRRSMTKDEKTLFGINKLNVKKSEIPAVTHVDYSARIQTVHKETNSKYYKLLSEFKKKTGCPVLVNTSFNVRGEPIVNTPKDAFNCFMGTELDILAIGNCYLNKESQNKSLKKDYKINFESD